MKILHLFALIFLMFACNQANKVNKKDDSASSADTVLNKIEKASKPEKEKEKEEDYERLPRPETLEQMEHYLRTYIAKDKVGTFFDAKKKYDKIKKDTVLVNFYFKYITEIENVMNSYAILETKIKEEQEEVTRANIWSWITQYLPYIRTTLECSECTSEAKPVFSVLLKKAEKTEGMLDNLLFETFLVLGDSRTPKIYGNWGCDYCWYNLLGSGILIRMIKQLSLLEKHPLLWNEKMQRMAEHVLYSTGDITIFGSTKKEVYTELNEIISFQDSTSIDLSNALKQREFLDTTREKITYSVLSTDGSAFSKYNY